MTTVSGDYRPPRPGESPTHLSIRLDDGTAFVVKTSNRDLVNWDRMRMRLKYGGGSDSPFIFAAFLAWSAASRSGDFAGPFDAAGGFLDSAEDITNLVLDVGLGEDADVRPTQPAARSV